MLKIKVIDGEIYASADDWQKLETNESEFFSRCYWGGVPWVETTPGGDLKLQLSKVSAIADKKRLKWLCQLCDDWKIELPDEWYPLFVEVSEKAKEEERAEQITQAEQRQLDEWNRQIERANRLMTNGCGRCQFLRVKGGQPYCKAAERLCNKRTDEEEREFYAKRESKVTGEKCEFYAKPYPCVDCPEMVQGRRALEVRSAWLDKQENK